VKGGFRNFSPIVLSAFQQPIERHDVYPVVVKRRRFPLVLIRQEHGPATDDNVAIEMAIFARRVVQRLLKENAQFLNCLVKWRTTSTGCMSNPKV
jgi:hypothetical protein